jgi:hypothetical protein
MAMYATTSSQGAGNAAKTPDLMTPPAAQQLQSKGQGGQGDLMLGDQINHACHSSPVNPVLEYIYSLISCHLPQFAQLEQPAYNIW